MMKFEFDHLTESYNREHKLILEKDYDESYIITVEDVLKAHYLICEYFENETGVKSLYGIKNYNLLSSAVARQSVALGNKFKYDTPLKKAATVFYGLVKNHAFHDGNKRTALLSLLYFLWKIGMVPTQHQKEFENLTTIIAADEYSKYKSWKTFARNSNRESVDLKIDFITKLIKDYTEKKDNSYKALTFRELNTMLHPYSFYLEPCGSQEANLCYQVKTAFGKTKTERLYQIGFKGWTKQVYEKAFKCIMAEIKKKTDIDAGTIYRGGEPMYKLIETYRGPLARLKDK